MLRFWASLLSQDRRQSGAIIRIAQCNPELGLDQVVRDALVVVVKAARHRRQPGGLERHERRRLHPETVVAYAAELLGMEPPPLVPLKAARLSPMARSFYNDNKRVANHLIKTELGVTLRYP